MILILLACGGAVVEDNTAIIYAAWDRDGDGVLNTVDCDPDDPLVAAPTNYWTDFDGDGWATWLGAFSSCDDPGDGYLTELAGEDCDDTNPEINPGVHDECDDEIDSDCDGFDCLEDGC